MNLLPCRVKVDITRRTIRHRVRLPQKEASARRFQVVDSRAQRPSSTKIHTCFEAHVVEIRVGLVRSIGHSALDVVAKLSSAVEAIGILALAGLCGWRCRLVEGVVFADAIVIS